MFFKACDKYDPEKPHCPTASGRPRLLDIPAQCPECHVQASQNQFRTLYGMVSFNSQHVLSQLDRVDLVRDSLNGADLHARNALEFEMQSLAQHTAKCAERFDDARNVAIKAFLGRLGEDAYSKHLAYMKDDCAPWTKPSSVEGMSSLRAPAYGDSSSSANLSVPDVNMSASQPADVPPTYSQLFPQMSEVPLNFTQQFNGEIGSVSSDSHGSDLDRIEILERLFRKLEGELLELGWARDPSLLGDYVCTRTQGSSQGPQERRVTQLRSQLKTLRRIFLEERYIVNASRGFERLAASARNIPARAANVASVREGFHFVVSHIYQARFKAGLSELLVPLNGTDPSSAHVIRLLPESMFPARVTGFPEYVQGQLDEYDGAEYAPLILGLRHVGYFAKEVVDVDEPVGVSPFRNRDADSQQQLTEAALRSHNGEPLMLEERKDSNRSHARDIVFNTRQWPAQVPDDYPEVSVTREAGLPQFTPVPRPSRDLPRLPAPPRSVPSPPATEPAQGPSPQQPDIQAPPNPGFGLLAGFSRDVLLFNILEGSVLHGLDHINDHLERDESPAWPRLGEQLNAMQMLCAEQRHHFALYMSNAEHRRMAQSLTHHVERTILRMSQHAASPERDDCVREAQALSDEIGMVLSLDSPLMMGMSSDDDIE